MMVHIRIEIVTHDGESKKPAIWQGLRKAGAFVYKVIESGEAFLLLQMQQKQRKSWGRRVNSFTCQRDWRYKFLLSILP